jgi:hypothetical protein
VDLPARGRFDVSGCCNTVDEPHEYG